MCYGPFSSFEYQEADFELPVFLDKVDAVIMNLEAQRWCLCFGYFTLQQNVQKFECTVDQQPLNNKGWRFPSAWKFQYLLKGHAFA